MYSYQTLQRSIEKHRGGLRKESNFIIYNKVPDKVRLPYVFYQLILTDILEVELNKMN